MLKIVVIKFGHIKNFVYLCIVIKNDKTMEAEKETWYVCATDKAFSNWKYTDSENKVAKRVVICESLEQAEQIARGMSVDKTLKYINVNMRKPHYNKQKYWVRYHNAKDCTLWLSRG